MKWKRKNGDVLTGQHPEYLTAIVDILKSNLAPNVIDDKLSDYHESDIALALGILTAEERYRVYQILKPEFLAEILEYEDNIEKYFDEMSITKQAEILKNFERTTAVNYLNSIDKVKRDSIMELVDDKTKSEILLVGSFANDEMGSRMSTNFIEIKNDFTVRQAMRTLISQAADNDNISTIYVTDKRNVFVGALDLKDLIIAREGTALESLITVSYPYVYDKEPVEDCIDRIKGYAEDSIPVLNGENCLVGVLTAGDITQMVDEEMGDDYAKFAGLTESEDLHEPLKVSIIKRLPWLIVLLGMGLIVSSVVGIFESVVASLTLIVCFQSLVLDMAGNVGTQSLAVTIRVIMDERVEKKEKLFLILKEGRVGLSNGILLGAASFLLIGVYLLIKGETAVVAFAVSGCTGIALLISMFISSLIGTVMPIFFQKLKIDPAVASGPFITTINDLVAVITYYGLAGIFLIGIMGM